MQVEQRRWNPEVRVELSLDLFNFDSTAAWDSPVVLTSPRSLAACRRAGVKPVELLYRSEGEVRAALGGDAIPGEVAHSLYRHHEQQRQAKLEACRAIRRQLVDRADRGGDSGCGVSPDLSYGELFPASPVRKAGGAPESQDSPIRSPGRELRGGDGRKGKTLTPSKSARHAASASSPDISAASAASTPESLHGVHASWSVSRLASKKDRLDRARTDDIPDIWREPADHPIPTPPPALPAAIPSPTRSLRAGASSGHRQSTTLVDCWGQAKSVRSSVRSPSLRLRARRPPPSSTPSSLSESVPTRPGSRAGSRPGSRRARRCPRRRPRAGRHLPVVCVQDCDDNSNLHSNLDSTNGSIDGGGSTTFHSCDQLLRRVRSPLARSPLATRCKAPSDLSSWLAGCAIPDDLSLPEHDRRILESMAHKKRMEKEKEELAHRAHQLWDQEREQRRKVESERAAKWRASVSARREWEAEDNVRRMEAMKRSLRLAQQRLEESIRLKEERARLRLMEEDLQRLVLQGERSKESAARRAEVDAKLEELRRRDRLYRDLLAEELRARQAQADGRRRAAQQQQHTRVASANREFARSRAQRLSLLARQAEEGTRLLRASTRERHRRADCNNKRQRRRRRQRALQASLERETRHVDARAMHADLELGLQLWRERCAALCEDAALRAQERAREHREGARCRVQRANQRRRRLHREHRARLVAEDDARQRTQRGQIRAKDCRIVQLRQSRERALEESRIQAYSTAALREELRRTLSPETFDRKAARVELEMRLTVRPATSSPSSTTRSHIHLG